MIIRWTGAGACAVALIVAGALVACSPNGGLLGVSGAGGLVAGDTAQAGAGRFSGDFDRNPMMRDLTDEQRAQLESLRAQLQSGEITRDEFVAQAQEIVGAEFNFAAGEGRPRFAALHGFGGGRPPVGLLGLSDEQRAAAREIFGAMRVDIQTLRAAGREEGRALLTDDQQAEITAIREATRDAVKERRVQARDEFRALLTDEQLAMLEELEANRPWQP